EDAAQAWLATRGGAPVGRDGHLAVYCLYKSIGVPDGGAAIASAALDPAAGAAPTGAAAVATRTALWLASRSAAAAGLAGRLERLGPGGVVALDCWSGPHGALPGEGFPRARARRATTVCLPVHQELRASDLERIVELVRGPRREPPPRLEAVADPDALGPEWD